MAASRREFMAALAGLPVLHLVAPTLVTQLVKLEAAGQPIEVRYTFEFRGKTLPSSRATWVLRKKFEFRGKTLPSSRETWVLVKKGELDCVSIEFKSPINGKWKPVSISKEQ